ncbi:lytic transglycosylase domain-containing protein [Colwellia asteriadis]|uniref:lytic transglycosylase domain-containing protein n=1 Tax=Colwellia asteriadis TaxID=517723 RepID=UPI0031CF4628
MTNPIKNNTLDRNKADHTVTNYHRTFTQRCLSLRVLIYLCCTYSATSLALAAEKTAIYTYKSAEGVTSFSDIAPINTHYETYRVDCYACEVNSLINWHRAKLYLTEHQEKINSAAQVNRIDPAFVRAIIHAESHFNEKAISKQGAQGLMQLMPRTAQSLGVTKPLDPEQNIYGGTRHLARLLKKYRGSHSLAAAAYNAGESAVKKYAGIPPFPETQVYVKRVNILLKRYIKSAPIQLTKN